MYLAVGTRVSPPVDTMLNARKLWTLPLLKRQDERQGTSDIWIFGTVDCFVMSTTSQSPLSVSRPRIYPTNTNIWRLAQVLRSTRRPGQKWKVSGIAAPRNLAVTIRAWHQWQTTLNAFCKVWRAPHSKLCAITRNRDAGARNRKDNWACIRD